MEWKCRVLGGSKYVSKYISHLIVKYLVIENHSGMSLGLSGKAVIDTLVLIHIIATSQ